MTPFEIIILCLALAFFACAITYELFNRTWAPCIVSAIVTFILCVAFFETLFYIVLGILLVLTLIVVIKKKIEK